MAESVVVDHAEFVAAASALPKMIRGPRGSFGNRIPKDTLLYAYHDRLVVYTPANKVSLAMVGAWSVCVSVEARQLALLSAKLKASQFLTISFDGRYLVLNAPAFALPAAMSEVPEDDPD